MTVDPFANVVAGLPGTWVVTVTPEVTVAHFSPGMPLVFATPMMILAMEMASGQALRGRLLDGFVSVGVDVNVRHLAASPVGRTVTASARVARHDGKLVHFDVEAHDGVRLIGRGTHSRAVVEVGRFVRGLPAGPAASP